MFGFMKVLHELGLKTVDTIKEFVVVKSKKSPPPQFLEKNRAQRKIKKKY